MSPLRLLSVPYLNAEPLIWGFRHGPFRALATIREVPPSRIPDLLRAGEGDVGLIPSIEFQRGEGLELLPHLGIASKTRARSVLLVSRVPLERIRSVALDDHSRTSAALLAILLRHRGLRDVACHEHAPCLGEMLREHDAALLIGNAALTADVRGLHVLDLAAEWFSITRLPFVFALWAARAGVTLPDGVRPFLESRQMGMANIPAIAREAAPRLGLTPGTIEDYLRVNLHYHLGSEEIRALDLFFGQACEAGLTPGRRPLQFREPLEREPVRAARGSR